MKLFVPLKRSSQIQAENNILFPQSDQLEQNFNSKV